MTALQWLQLVNEMVCGLFSTEKPGTKATNSELKRWLKNGAVHINSQAIRAEDVINKLDSFVLFPNGKRRTTIW